MTNLKTKRKIINSDKIAEKIIKTVGILTISSIGIILVFMLLETLPIFYFINDPGILNGKEFSFVLSLFWGTMKGAVAAMFFAVPFGLSLAFYFSIFSTTGRWKFATEVIDFLAYIPTVIFGFIAAVCIAPYFGKIFPLVCIIAVAIPISILASKKINEIISKKFKRPGPETVMTLIIACSISLLVMITLKETFFIRDFGGWLYNVMGVNFEQRNGLLVGFALGLSVTPLIFSLSKNAINSVPNSYKVSSYALGASKLQTLVKVIIPNSLTGIISSILIAFGKALGETMILLMVSGNTPLIELNPFSGMQSVSANIITEISEVQYHSPYFYFLFTSASVLMLFTFTLNTIAEVIKNKQMKKYEGRC